MAASTSREVWKVPSSWRVPSASIEISYRDEGGGKGAFYDHYTIQRGTGRETQISIPQGMAPSDLVAYLKTGTTHNLRFGIPTAEGKRVPKITEATDQVGLLIIPGHAREMETKRAGDLATRNAYEQAILRDAIRKGRPILGICGGSSQIWNLFNVIARDEREISIIPWIIRSKDHAWRNMPRINADGSVGNNVSMHRVVIPATTMLASTSTKGWAQYKRMRASAAGSQQTLSEIHPEIRMIVNSVHWEAPNRATLPTTEETLTKRGPKHLRNLFEINASSLHDPSVAPSNKVPEDNVVEGFELTCGAPILGIVWHPEAHNPDGSESATQNRCLLRYMAQAGDAYAAKVRMLASLKQQHEMDLVTSKLGKISLKPKIH